MFLHHQPILGLLISKTWQSQTLSHTCFSSRHLPSTQRLLAHSSGGGYLDDMLHQFNIRRMPIPPTFNYLGMASPRLISCLVDSLTAMPKRLQKGGNKSKENTLMNQW